MADLIYIVDDEPHIRQLLVTGLGQQGYEVRPFENGASLFAALFKAPEAPFPAAIVLDRMLPGGDGIHILKDLRADPYTMSIPILMLTARRAEPDRVSGLESGADDYLTKPFSMRELAARLRALIRRQQPAFPGTCLSHEGIEMHVHARQVLRSGSPVELTTREFDLLHALMRNRGRVMPRDMLLDLVWGVDYFGDTRTLDVYIRYLRKKLEDDPENPKRIRTVRGVGYQFV